MINPRHVDLKKNDFPLKKNLNKLSLDKLKNSNKIKNSNKFSRKISKKGAAAWLSWVLIVAFSVGLGAFMFRWMTGFTEGTTSQITSRVEQSDCNQIGISVADACQTVGELRLNLVNKKGLNIDQVLINYIDLYDNPGTKIINVSLRINKPERVSILKQGIIKQFEIIPRSVSKDKVISCTDNVVVVSNIKQCG